MGFPINKKMCSRFGFTLVEVLIVIAIIAVLAGIAVPSIITVRSNLKSMELDSAAKSIYIAAQNRMSELRVSGELKFDGTVSSLGGDLIEDEPGDFPDELGEWKTGEYFLLSSGDDLTALIPDGSLEAMMASGYYYIEYNAKTGMVYGVFYSDKSFEYSAELPRGRYDRRAHNPVLGYYGGEGIDFTEVYFTPIPEFLIVNEDRLYIELTRELNTVYEISVSDTFGNTWVYSTDEIATPDNVKENVDTYVVVLDSLESGEQFKDRMSGLVPGSNLNVTVTATETDKIPTSASGSTNSLFASLSGDGKAIIIYPRHLQNLCPAFSGVNAGVTHANVTHAVLGNDIDWGATGLAFQSINNTVLTSFDGSGNAIRGLNAALFDSFAGSASQSKEIRDISLINANVISSGSSSLSRGLLINTAEYVDFTGCRVYAEGSPVTPASCTLVTTGPTATGGLIGKATYCNITGSSASLTKISGNSGSVGGLVGESVNSVITRSYAATGIWDSTEIAWVADTGIFLTAGQRAGGFAGYVKGGSVTYCYAIGNVNAVAGTTASGFAGWVYAEGASLAQMSNNYCATTFNGNLATAIHGFGYVHNSTTSSVDGSSCYYFASEVVKTYVGKGTGLSLGGLSKLFAADSAWQTAGAASTKPYARTGEALPFKQMSGSVHYGDWPDTPIKGGLYYYEKYSNGSYGYYPEITGKLLNDTLTVVEDGYVVLLELAEGDTPPADITIDCRASGSGSYYKAVTLEWGDGWPVITGKAVYPIEEDDLVAANSNTNLYEIRVGADRYYYNPNFAKSVSETMLYTTAPTVNYEIRTARHLNRLATLWWPGAHYYKGNVRYTQTRDINFATYGTSGSGLKTLPIGYDGCAMIGTYDGGGYSITITNITRDDYAALFGDVHYGGVLKNVNIIGTGAFGRAYITAGTVDGSGNVTESGNYAGGLTANVKRGGTIENCTVTNVVVQGGENIGGLIGNTWGGATVKNCTVTNVQVLGAGPNVGGFTGRVSRIGTDEEPKPGEITGELVDGIISGCVVSEVYVAVTTNNGGGFAGLNMGTIENCAVSGSIVRGRWQIGGFVGSNEGTIRKSSAANGYFGTDTTGGGMMREADDAIPNPERFGGFVGNNFSNGTIEYCYAITRFGGVYSGGFVGANRDSAEIRNSYCATIDSAGSWAGFYETNSSTITYCIAFNGSNLGAITGQFTGGVWGAADSAHSFPYDPELAGEAYIFPAVVKTAGVFVHYGNWPEPKAGFAGPNGLYYYEKYEDGTYGFYGIVNSVEYEYLDDEKVVLEDGYVYVHTGDTPTIRYRSLLYYPNYEGHDFSESFTSVSSGDIITVDLGSGLYAYTITRQMESKIVYADTTYWGPRTGYYELLINGKLYYYNADFAKTAISPNSDGTTTPPPSSTVARECEVRTARQLARLATGHDDKDYRVYYRTSSYTQTRDIDFSTYVNPPTFSHIGKYNHSFQGSYDGGNFSITMTGNLTTYGLFGLVNGTVKNVNLIGKDGTEINGSGNSVGGLVGYLDGGTISNCTVTGVSIKGGGASGSGGLVGIIASGTVEDCEVTNVAVYSSSDAVGGFVGRLANGTVRNCTVTATSAITIQGSGTVGGFVGNKMGGTVSYCSVTGVGVIGGGNNGGFAGDNGGRIENSAATDVTVNGTGWQTGGFVGHNTGVIDSCELVGATVTGELTTGPFYGIKGTVTNCTMDGSPVS